MYNMYFALITQTNCTPLSIVFIPNKKKIEMCYTYTYMLNKIYKHLNTYRYKKSFTLF